MMGFYPDCPGDPSYTLTTPTFDKITISLNPELCSGKSLLVISKSGKGKIIRSIRRGGRKFGQYRISHRDLVSAGTIEYFTK